MERVVDYARVSTEEERQLAALITQQEENKEFIAKQTNWIHVDSYVDESKTGTTMQGRSEFLRMLSDMEENKFDTILIKQIDRGWRNLGDWKLFESELLKNHIRLFVRLKNEYYNIEDDGSYISTTMDNLFSEWFSRNLSKKLRNAHQTRMKKGVPITNGTTWGYDQVRGSRELTVNEKEAEVVKLIFELYAEGQGYRRIAEELSKRGITSRNGKPFATSTLNKMITNEKYKGTLICGKTRYNFFTKKNDPVPKNEWFVHENQVPIIIEPELWEKANRILKSKQLKYRNDDSSLKQTGYFTGLYPLSGKMKCALCGAPYHHGFETHKPITDPEKRVGYWQCNSYRKYGRTEMYGCKSPTLYDDNIYTVIKKVIYDYWKEKTKHTEVALGLLDRILDENVDDGTREKLLKDKAKLESNREKLIDLYYDDEIEKSEYVERRNVLDNKLKTIENNLTNLEEDSTIVLNRQQRLKEISNFLNTELTDAESVDEDAFKFLLEGIVVHEDHTIEVSFIDATITTKARSARKGRWAAEEDNQFLRDNYPSASWDVLLERFPSMKRVSIRKKASKLGIKRDRVAKAS